MSRDRLFNGSKNTDGSRDYKTAIVDASIVGGFTFFSSLAGGALVSSLMQDASPAICLIGAGVSAGLAFFTSLMISLGVKKPEVK